MAGSMSELMVLLPAFYFMNQIDWTQPENVMNVRIGFGVSTSLCLIALVYVYTQIKAKNDRTKVTVPPMPYSGT